MLDMRTSLFAFHGGHVAYYALMYAARLWILPAARSGAPSAASLPASVAAADAACFAVTAALFTVCAVTVHRWNDKDLLLEGQACASRDRAHGIVHNLMPAPVLMELQAQSVAVAAAIREIQSAADATAPPPRVPKPPSLAWAFPAVCILQSDIVGFTQLCARITAEEVCQMLHDLFRCASWWETVARGQTRARHPHPSHHPCRVS